VTWLLDCDGVVWLSEQVIAGAPEALASLRASGSRVVLLTNNSYPRRSDHVAKLERLGMPTDPADVLSSAMAAALLLEAGERALVLGGPGVIEELTARGVATVTPGTGREIGPVDAVVVGLDPSFDFSSIAAAVAALHAGARLIGTNDDPTFPTPAGVLPGAGALLAAVARASEVTPTIAGKPYQPTVDLVRKRVGEVEMVVGDRASTDGLLARRLDARFGLVLTGITPAGHGLLDPAPDLEAPDLLALVDAELGRGPSRRC
jgi:4-nitrophenyl phosphatase